MPSRSDASEVPLVCAALATSGLDCVKVELKVKAPDASVPGLFSCQRTNRVSPPKRMLCAPAVFVKVPFRLYESLARVLKRTPYSKKLDPRLICGQPRRIWLVIMESGIPSSLGSRLLPEYHVS